MMRSEHIEALCPELGAVVADAALSGNHVVETWRGFGNAVRLQRTHPVLEGLADEVRRTLRYRPVNDPHYWRGEIHCREHPEWFIALPFEAGPPPDLGLDPLKG